MGKVAEEEVGLSKPGASVSGEGVSTLVRQKTAVALTHSLSSERNFGMKTVCETLGLGALISKNGAFITGVFRGNSLGINRAPYFQLAQEVCGSVASRNTPTGGS
jgi:hypothetical protein